MGVCARGGRWRRRARSGAGSWRRALRSELRVTSPGWRSVERDSEWLETDGLGGFASGTTSGVRTRRYHALLLAAAKPPADRRVLVQGFVA
ncbi:MAG TPA: glycogen debranching enzyme N-terminal domain-containing protein, partial [Polyangiaceae bacterium]|nr:glycogen debranching enzyme N-terminal domain-containing protein [Polyangiaceae bacterium]